MLSLTTHLAAKYPDLLDGDYETRVEILNNLTKKSGEILERKSRRLAKMTPEKIELWRINSEKEINENIPSPQKYNMYHT